MLMRTSHATEKHILSDDHMGHGQEGFRSAASSSFSKAEAVAQGTNNPLKMSCADQDSIEEAETPRMTDVPTATLNGLNPGNIPQPSTPIRPDA